MNKEDILEKVKLALFKAFRLDREISLSDDFKNNLGLNSLDHVELMMEIEKEFSISIPDEEVEKLFTIGETVEYLFVTLNKND